MTQIYRPEDEPDELCSRCGHRERAHVPAPIGTCTVSEVAEGGRIGCTCKGYLAYSPEPVEPKRCVTPGCGHGKDHHPDWNGGRCTWTTQIRLGEIVRVNTCLCGEFRESAASPAPPIEDDPRGQSPENLLEPWEDPCHAILWMEPGRKADLLVTAQRPMATRWALRCRFATGHEDPFHEHYDGTRWMIQTEDR